MNNLTWQAMMMDYDAKNNVASILLQAAGNRLYTFKVNNPNAKTIGVKIAETFGIVADRVIFEGEPRRRDKAIVFIYLVMYDEMPVGVDN